MKCNDNVSDIILDFKPIVNKMIELVGITFVEDLGFRQIDFSAYEGYIHFPSIKSFVVLYPKLLYHGNGIHLWVACKFTDHEILIDAITEHFKENFNKLRYRPFYDEDAYKYFFSRPKKEECVSGVEFSSCEFYLNPYLPKGAWENHVL